MYVKTELTKSKAREKYIVLQVDKVKETATLQKLLDNKSRRNPILVHLKHIFKHNECNNSVEKTSTSHAVNTKGNEGKERSPDEEELHEEKSYSELDVLGAKRLVFTA